MRRPRCEAHAARVGVIAQVDGAFSEKDDAEVLASLGLEREAFGE